MSEMQIVVFFIRKLNRFTSSLSTLNLCSQQICHWPFSLSILYPQKASPGGRPAQLHNPAPNKKELGDIFFKELIVAAAFIYVLASRPITEQGKDGIHGLTAQRRKLKLLYGKL